MIEYNPIQWKHGENITIGQFCDYLKQYIPHDAAFRV